MTIPVPCQDCGKPLSPEEKLLNAIFGSDPLMCSKCTREKWLQDPVAGGVFVNGVPLRDYLNKGDVHVD